MHHPNAHSLYRTKRCKQALKLKVDSATVSFQARDRSSILGLFPHGTNQNNLQTKDTHEWQNLPIFNNTFSNKLIPSCSTAGDLNFGCSDKINFSKAIESHSLFDIPTSASSCWCSRVFTNQKQLVGENSPLLSPPSRCYNLADMLLLFRGRYWERPLCWGTRY